MNCYNADDFFFQKKQVSTIMKYHNHTLQTNPRHREEEPQNTRHQEDNQSKVWRCSGKKSWIKVLKFEVALI